MVNFYGDSIGEKVEDGDKVRTERLFTESKEIPTVKVSDLPSGYKVLQIPEVTERIGEYRNKFLRYYERTYVKISEYKARKKNELDDRVQYLKKNIFVDKYENEELLAPISLLGLGAFFTGRILTNPTNWGYGAVLIKGQPTFFGMFMSSVPARIILPIFLAGYTFNKFLPVTSSKVVETCERDVLPKNVTKAIKDSKRQLYTEGLVNTRKTISQAVYRNCEDAVHRVRMSIADQLDKW